MFDFLRGRRRVHHVWGAGNIWTPNAMNHWLQHPRVQARINAMITEGFPGDRFGYFLGQYLNGQLPIERALTIGCGTGELERGLVQYRFARFHEGLDLAPDAIAKARDAAQTSGMTSLTYQVADANTLHLEANRYDVVFGISAIHHVERLEHLFEQVHASLRPQGYFFWMSMSGLRGSNGRHNSKPSTSSSRCCPPT